MFLAVLLPIADRGDEVATVFRTDARKVSCAGLTFANLGVIVHGHS